MKNSNKSNQILQAALQNLEASTPWRVLEKTSQKPTGAPQIVLAYGSKKLILEIEVRSVLQEAQLPKLLTKRSQKDDFLVVAGRISQAMKEKLRDHHINYLESGGNAFLETDTLFILIEGKKSGFSQKRKHLFTNASIQLLFHLFLNPNLLKKTYRQIAQATGGSLDNISKTLRTLRDNHYVQLNDKGGFIFANKKSVIERWVPEYGERLKPSLFIGRFSFLPDVNWKFLQMDTSQTRWGGEPAAEKIFGLAQPTSFTLYTQESQQDLIRNYRLIPDPEGSIYAYQTFWDINEEKNKDTVPELLIYADLLLSKNKRNIEVARRLLEMAEDNII